MPAFPAEKSDNPTGHVIDTNVLMLAHYPPPPERERCSLQCIEWLIETRKRLTNNEEEYILLDEKGLVLQEYNQQFQQVHKHVPAGEQSLAFAFLLWLFEQLGNQDIVQMLPLQLERNGEMVTAVVPEDLPGSFDPNDRKFLALALAWHNLAVIHNATDTDWNEIEDWISQTEGIELHQLCPELVK